jgi:hypothetical protein
VDDLQILVAMVVLADIVLVSVDDLRLGPVVVPMVVVVVPVVSLMLPVR